MSDIGKHPGTATTLDELQSEFGQELMRRAKADTRPGHLPQLRRLAPALGVLALVGGGAGVAIAASSGGEQPPIQVNPVAVGEVVRADGTVVQFSCQAESEWFFAALGEEDEELSSPGANLPVPPKDICDGQPPIPSP